MELEVTEVYYEDYSLRPRKDEVFMYQANLQLIYVFSLSQRVPPDYPYEHVLTEVLNVKHTKSFTLDPTRSRVCVRETLGQEPVPTDTAPTSTPLVEPHQTGPTSYVPTSEWNKSVCFRCGKSPCECVEAKICTCEDLPDPDCPVHGE